MTCVIGLKHNGKVYLGGDSAAICPSSLSIRKNLAPKVFQNGEFIFGYAGSFRMGQLLQHAFNPPEQSKHQGDLSYLVTSFIMELHDTWSTFKHINQDSSEADTTFLFCYNDRLYIVEDDFQLREMEEFEAIGCGSDLAIGSLASTREWTDPIARIETALKVAAEFSAGVMGPFHIISSEEDS